MSNDRTAKIARLQAFIVAASALTIEDFDGTSESTLIAVRDSVRSFRGDIADLEFEIRRENREAEEKARQESLLAARAAFAQKFEEMRLTANEIHTYENAEPGHSGKISAIKLVRERTGLGLADAKTLVEREANRLCLLQASERNAKHWA